MDGTGGGKGKNIYEGLRQRERVVYGQPDPHKDLEDEQAQGRYNER